MAYLVFLRYKLKVISNYNFNKIIYISIKIEQMNQIECTSLAAKSFFSDYILTGRNVKKKKKEKKIKIKTKKKQKEIHRLIQFAG